MAELLARASGPTRALWDGLRLYYTESAGHPRLRAAIAGLYDGVDPDDVLVFAGAEEAIFAWASTELGPATTSSWCGRPTSRCTRSRGRRAPT